MTSRSTRGKAVWTIFGIAAAVALGAVGKHYFDRLMKVDPFAEFNAKPSTGDSTTIRLEKAKLYTYDSGVLKGIVDLDAIDVSKDRQRMTFHGIREGKLQTKKGEINFSTKLAEYDAGNKVLKTNSNARLWNKDMDIQINGFTYSEKNKKLEIPTKIKGKFFDGEIEADTLVYAAEDDSYILGPTVWTGTPPKSLVQDEPVKRSKWQVKAKRTEFKGDKAKYTKIEATDNEIIIFADNADLDRKTDVLTATGNVRYFSADTNMSCQRCVVYRKEKRAVLTGDVTMLMKPEDREKLEVIEIPPFRPIVPDAVAASRPAAGRSNQEKERDDEIRSGKSIRKYPVSVLAEEVEYFYAKGNRKANVRGNPQARQELAGGRWRHVWATSAFYDGESEQLRINGGAKKCRIKTSLGDDLQASWFRFSTKENADDDAEGEDIEGTIAVDEEELPDRTKSGAPPPTKSTTGGGPSGPIGN